jgi:hypothetical protein
MKSQKLVIVTMMLATLAPAYGQSSSSKPSSGQSSAPKTISITLKNGDGADVMLSVTDKVTGREIYHAVFKGNADTSAKVAVDANGKSDLVWKAQATSGGKCRTGELKQLSDGQRVGVSAEFSGYGNAC